MDELKQRAGEKLDALHEAAKSAAGNSKSKVEDVVSTTLDAFRKVREAFNEIWHHELIAESRQRVAAWSKEALRRIKEGAPPLSPVLLYEELVALFKDRVWRRSVVIFVCGAAIGGGAGIALGLRIAARVPTGPHARALHTLPDHTVILVGDAVTPGAGAGEVLVRVQAFSVGVTDRAVLRGRGAALRGLLLKTTQLTVGRAFAGVVLDVGHGVTELELGDEVWGTVSEWSGGAASELLTIRSTRVCKRPRSLSADSAASLPWSGALALSALDRLKYNHENCKGKRVAICGASSGEGCVLVQVLSAWGALPTVAAPRHTARHLKEIGAHEFVDMDSNNSSGMSWVCLETAAARGGPWDAVLTCAGAAVPPVLKHNTAALLKATAPRNAILDLRPQPLISDALPTPFAFLFAASLYTFRMLRWMIGLGMHTDWLEDKYRLTPGLEELRNLVDSGQLQAVLDKTYQPQEFESALAHACSDDALGTTVIRFP